MHRVFVGLALLLVLSGSVQAQSVEGLVVGHWVELKGAMNADDRFVVDILEVLPPGDTEVLIGIARDVDVAGSSFRVLGQVVHASARTQWRDVDLNSIADKRVKVEGHFRGGSKFSARQVSARGAGNDRITGRLDALESQPAGRAGRVMGFEVWIPNVARFENTASFSELKLAPFVEFASSNSSARGADDYIPGTYRLAENFYMGGLIDSKSEHRRDFDFDSTRKADLSTSRLSVRLQLLWTPSDRFTALFSPRYEVGWREDERFAAEQTGGPHVQELWVHWKDVASTGVDLQAGRQLFRDQREWLYKTELDGIRGVWSRASLRVEASATTVLSDGDDRDEHSDNLMLYVSNNDEIQHLAAYVIDRRDAREPRDYPLHLGVRALGEWIPNTMSWVEASLLRGYQGETNLRGYGFDIGTTWTPSTDGPVYAFVGYAHGSGDDSSTSGANEAFRQSGFQGNNGKFGGVTSYRYYGELLDPELSNIGITTFGVGTRLARKSSIDLAWHTFTQAEVSNTLLNAALKIDPDGVHRSLGQEVDLIFGTRAWSGFDFELVLGWFDPGPAFPARDDAWMGSFQIRYRF